MVLFNPFACFQKDFSSFTLWIKDFLRMFSKLRKIIIFFLERKNDRKAYFTKEKLDSLKRKLPVLVFGTARSFSSLDTLIRTNRTDQYTV
jgi:hypothetical protein